MSASIFLDYLAKLPPNVNAFDAAADKIEEMLRSPRSPLWSRRLRIVVLVLYCIIFVQSVYLLYQRSQIHKNAKLKYNRVGLVVINISDSSALAYFFYAPLTIYVIAINVAMDQGHLIDESTMVCVFGHKFMAIVLGSWALLWGSASQCAQIFWNSDLASNMDREKLRLAIKWSMYTFFFIGAIVPLPVISWLYIQAYQRLREIEIIIHGIASSLRAKSGTYDPTQSSVLTILMLIRPARGVERLERQLELALVTSTTIYCAIILVLIAVYIPLLTISLRALYNQSVSQSKIDAVMGSSLGSKPSRISKKIQRERQRLVYHALCVFLSTAVHLPPTLWKVFHTQGDFLHDLTFKEVTQHGLVAPLAFSGNLILVLLNFHSYQILRDRKMREKNQQATLGSGQESEPPCRRTGIRTLFISQSDDEEISLHNVAESTEVGSQMAEKSEKYRGSSPPSPAYMSTSLAGIKIKQSTYSTTT